MYLRVQATELTRTQLVPVPFFLHYSTLNDLHASPESSYDRIEPKSEPNLKSIISYRKERGGGVFSWDHRLTMKPAVTGIVLSP